jgi:hypothetical protein
MEKPAITDQLVVPAKDDGELRRQTSLVPGDKFLQHSLRFLTRVRAERKAHEVRVRHQLRQRIEILLAERTQD